MRILSPFKAMSRVQKYERYKLIPSQLQLIFMQIFIWWHCVSLVFVRILYTFDCFATKEEQKPG